MTVLILVVDAEADVEALFRQHFRLRDGRFVREFRAVQRGSPAAHCE